MADRIASIDLSQRLSAEESEKRILAAQHRLVQLRLTTAGLLDPPHQGPGLLVLFEGLDAAGKGGTIRRLVQGLDPRHVLVRPIGPPTTEESRHHFLWRFQSSIPGRGEMTVFDRSWYGRLLVERVEHLIDRDGARRSAQEIVDFENALVNDGVTVVKFWLHVSDEEQLRRFNERASNPLKQWKLTEDDWRNRSKRPAYLEALGDAIEWTDHPHAHWDLIGADDKHYARATILETLIERWIHDLGRHGVTVPPAHGGDYLL
ncbi:MAG TPA: UDP-galactose-lipid carrier transferase [Acidimicrobiales bacterium]|nr:UDP-galactose-lipid carrier transferase [Acidimicrobiales bacterium]